MDDALEARIKEAVIEWAQKIFSAGEIVVGQPAEDESEDDEADRYLVDFAVRKIGYWMVAEVWVADNEILSVNDIGEGLPLDDIDWPWPSDLPAP